MTPITRMHSPTINTIGVCDFVFHEVPTVTLYTNLLDLTFFSSIGYYGDSFTVGSGIDR